MTAQTDDESLRLLGPPLQRLALRRWRSLVFGSRSAPEGPLPKAARWERNFVASILALDIVLVAVAVGGGVFLRFGEIDHVTPDNAAVALLLGPAWIGLLILSRAYERERISLGTEQLKAIFEASVRMAALVAFFVYATKTEVSRGFFLIALPGGFTALLGGRLVARALLHRARRRGRYLHRVLVIGHVADIEHLIGQLEDHAQHGLKVVGACALGSDGDEIRPGVPLLGPPDAARRAAAEVGADTVAVTSSGVLGREGLRKLAWQLEGSDTNLLLTPELTDVAGPRVSIRPVGGLSLLQVSQPKFSGASQILKGAFTA